MSTYRPNSHERGCPAFWTPGDPCDCNPCGKPEGDRCRCVRGAATVTYDGYSLTFDRNQFTGELPYRSGQ